MQKIGNVGAVIFIAICLIDWQTFASAEPEDYTDGFYPGYVGALNSTITNLMTQLKVYQQYIDQAFQPLHKYDKIFKRPINSYTVNEEPYKSSDPVVVQKIKLTEAPAILPHVIGEYLIPSKQTDNLTPMPIQEQNLPKDTTIAKEDNAKDSSLEELLSVISSEMDPTEPTLVKNIETPATHNFIPNSNSDRTSILANISESNSGIEKSQLADSISKQSGPSSLSFPESDLTNFQHSNPEIDTRIGSSKPKVELLNPSLSSICGIFDPNKFVTNRKRDHILWPWMVSLGKQYKSGFVFKCGATLVDSNVVVTSAHCFSQRNNIETADIAGHKIKLGDIIVHPEYRANIGYNDIAVVKLTRSLDWNSSSIVPACLPETLTQLDKANSVSWSSEWRHRNDNGVLALRAKNVFTRILNSSFCEDEFLRAGHDPQDMFPEGFGSTLLCVKSSRARLCQGDSGISLLTRNKSGQSYLLGTIVKGEDSCGDVQLPSVYTRVSEFRDWIQQQMTTFAK